MTHISSNIPAMAALLGTSALSLTGCGETEQSHAAPPQAAVVTIVEDVSSSTAQMNSPTYAARAIEHVGKAVTGQQLGDEFRVIAVGDRSTDHAVSVASIATGYKVRLPVARRQVEQALNDLIARNRQRGGDGSTNILYALENAQPVCTPRSKLIVMSDGVEASEGYSVIPALLADKPVQLPPASVPYLKGCAVEFIGIGVSPDGTGQQAQTLPNAQVQALIAAWRGYFQSAGVKPSDMTFTSIL